MVTQQLIVASPTEIERSHGQVKRETLALWLLLQMKITIAHSPDSDDAFMFYGLVCGGVTSDGLEIEQVMADIETLNHSAVEGKYDVTAVSFHAYAYLLDKYVLLPHGASMGEGYGPIVVARPNTVSRLKGVRVAIPGERTTASLVLRLFEPDFQPYVVPFDQIQRVVAEGEAAAGLLIHEGQLTYTEDGLTKLMDLGEWWSKRTDGLPLPLGGNVIRRALGPEIIARVSRLLRDSIVYARKHRSQAIEYAQQFSRGLDRDRVGRFVGMYVNDLTLDYGERGRSAVNRLFNEAYQHHLIPGPIKAEFAQ